MTTDTVGPYQLLSMIGRGNLGEVWRARDTRNDREVALKLLDGHLAGDARYAHRFHREVAATAEITFPRIVPIHDFGELNGRLFVAMALVEGTNLASLLKQLGPLPAERAIGITTQVAEALDHLHRAGGVHRDVKPSNILIRQDNSGADFAYLLDLGIAHALDDTGISLSGAVILSPAYLAPECFDGDSDRFADIYGLACVLYEALTGMPPFPVKGLWALHNAHRHALPPRPTDANPELPTPLNDVVACGLAKDPNHRFPTASALAATARAALVASALTGSAAPPSSIHPTQPSPPSVTLPLSDFGTRPRIPPVPPPRPAQGPSQRQDHGRWVIAYLLYRRLCLLTVAVVALVATVAPSVFISIRDSAPPTGSALRRAPALLASFALGSEPQSPVLTPDGRKAYVVNRCSGTVSVIDTYRLAVITVIRIATDQCVTTPDGITPDGRFLYVTDASDGSDAVIDTRSDTVIGKLPFEGGDKIFIPDGLGHVADSVGGRVTTFDSATNRVVASVSVGERPHGIVLGADNNLYTAESERGNTVTAVNPYTSIVAGVIRVGATPTSLLQIPGRRVLYVTSETAGAVYVIDVDRKAVVNTLEIGGTPAATKLSSDGRTAYVVNRSGSLIVIDTATDKVVTSVPLTGIPFAAVLTPDGQTVYVVSGGRYPGPDDGMLTVIRTSDYSVVKKIPLGANAFDPVLSPDGRTIVISNNGSNTVTVIDTADKKAVGTVVVGDAPYSGVISRDGTRVYVSVIGTSALAVVDLGTVAR